ncbi:hypothetical protein NDU88_004767 [Pleurodeles waltl]|uniref:Uncharacterized protein n=1 Tax=Pleurodeles waltl TaxID=8319 RepID=A0AAV7SJV7_PLEWA|nr:hypothetical protein NDU88_004767 [Pleurodeles waltl]
MARSRRSRARRARKRSKIQAGPGAHAPDLEQLIQERREGDPLGCGDQCLPAGVGVGDGTFAAAQIANLACLMCVDPLSVFDSVIGWRI